MWTAEAELDKQTTLRNFITATKLSKYKLTYTNVCIDLCPTSLQLEIFPMARKTKLEASATRDSILDAAELLFERHHHLDTDGLLATNIELLTDAIRAPGREPVESGKGEER